MRIACRIADEPLHRALTELLVFAGHDVPAVDAVAPRPDLLVTTRAEFEDIGDFGMPAVLVLGGATASPAPEGAAVATGADPTRELENVLEHGGVAFWPAPFEPRRLIDVLAARKAPRAARTPRDDGAFVAPLDDSTDPWLLLDVVRRVVVRANTAARVLFGMTADAMSDALRRLPLAAVADLAFERPAGRRRVEHLGRPWLAIWWTDSERRRALGLIELPVALHEDPQGNLRALAGLGRLSATLAHEIRNPLAALAGALDLLESDADPAERPEVISLARQRLNQMKTLLDDTLRLARPFKRPPAPLDPAAVVRSAVDGVRTDALFRGIDLRVDVGAESVTAVGHEEALRQAITNLLLNAAQAQEGKGSIRVRMTEEDGWVVIRVIDAGPGIAAEHREKVFEPFWTTKASGTGLGLSYVRRAAEASGGRVLVEDAAGGACVRIDLPRAG